MGRHLNNVGFSPNNSGTGNIEVGTRINNSFALPAEAGAVDGQQFAWRADEGGDSLIFRGTFTDAAPDTISRDVILQSMISGVKGTTNFTLTTAAQVREVVIGEDFPFEEVFIIAASDETTGLTTGTGKVSFDIPFAITITDIIATVSIAPTGSTLIVDVNDGGTSIMTTDKLVIDAGETSTKTAATAPTLTDTALAADATITVDIDQIGSSIPGAGLKIYLIGFRP